MLLQAVSCWRHSVFGLYVRECVRDHLLKVCKHSILRAACGNSTRFATEVQQVTKMNWLFFEVKGQGHSKTICTPLVKVYRSVVYHWRPSAFSASTWLFL